MKSRNPGFLVTSLRKKTWVPCDQIEDVALNFHPCLFRLEFYIWLMFLLPGYPFILRLSLRLKIPQSIRALSEMDRSNFKQFKMAYQRWQMLPVAFSVTNDVIMKSLTLSKIIYVLSNFLDFIRDFYHLNIFRFMSTLKEIWRILQISATIWRHNDARLRYVVNQVMSRSWKHMSTLVCVISVVVGIGVLKSQEAKKRSLNKVKECTYRQMTLKFRWIIWFVR